MIITTICGLIFLYLAANRVAWAFESCLGCLFTPIALIILGAIIWWAAH